MQLYRLLAAIDHQMALFGKIDVGLIRTRRVGEKDVAPPAAGNRVAHVDDSVGKLLEEHVWFDVGFGARRNQPDCDLAKCLVRVWQCDNHLVSGRKGSGRRNDRDRTKEAHEADAARLERDEFAIGRQAAEAD